jgi:hypothetical protein
LLSGLYYKRTGHFYGAARAVLGRSCQKIGALRRELMRAGVIKSGGERALFEIGPPISPLHS